MLSLPSFFCELSFVPCPYPRPPPPFLVILLSGLLPSSKVHSTPQALQSCGQKAEQRGLPIQISPLLLLWCHQQNIGTPPAMLYPGDMAVGV